jgi:hypothetical protein
MAQARNVSSRTLAAGELKILPVEIEMLELTSGH